MPTALEPGDLQQIMTREQVEWTVTLGTNQEVTVRGVMHALENGVLSFLDAHGTLTAAFGAGYWSRAERIAIAAPPVPPSAVCPPEAPSPALKHIPKVTVQDIESEIAWEYYILGRTAVPFAAVVGPANIAVVDPCREISRLTICVLVLRNGFLVTGESACVDARNFDEAQGRKYAREDAVRKCWPILGYRLKDRLYADAINNVRGGDFGTEADDKAWPKTP